MKLNNCYVNIKTGMDAMYSRFYNSDRLYVKTVTKLYNYIEYLEQRPTLV